MMPLVAACAAVPAPSAPATAVPATAAVTRKRRVLPSIRDWKMLMSLSLQPLSPAPNRPDKVNTRSGTPGERQGETGETQEPAAQTQVRGKLPDPPAERGQEPGSARARPTSR